MRRQCQRFQELCTCDCDKCAHVGSTESPQELCSEEVEYDKLYQGFGNVFHSVGYIFRRFKFANQYAVNKTNSTGEHEEQRNDGLHYRGFKACNYTVFVTEDGISRHQSQRQTNAHSNQYTGSNVERTIFFCRNFGVSIFCYVDIIIQRASFPQPRFGNFFSNIPASCDYCKSRSKCEEIVAKYVYFISRVNQASSTLSKALDYRVNCRRSVVCRKSTCDTCERSSDTCQRMFAGCIEHISSNRNDNYITGIRTDMGNHTCENDNRS